MRQTVPTQGLQGSSDDCRWLSYEDLEKSREAMRDQASAIVLGGGFTDETGFGRPTHCASLGDAYVSARGGNPGRGSVVTF